MRIKGVGEPINLSTGIYIMSTDWDKKKSIVKSKNPKFYFFNSEIKKMESLIWKYYEEKTKKGNLLDRHVNRQHKVDKDLQSMLLAFSNALNLQWKVTVSLTWCAGALPKRCSMRMLRKKVLRVMIQMAEHSASATTLLEKCSCQNTICSPSHRMKS